MQDPLGTVLVTGGAGFIGCALSEALIGQAREWVVLDNLHPQVHADQVRPSQLHADANLVRGDVTDAVTWDSLLARVRPDTVIHLAAETGTAQSLDESTRHGMVNVVGTTTMLDAFTRAGHVPRHVLLTSSRAVYGEGLWTQPDGSSYLPPLRSHAQLAEGRWDHEGEHQPNSFETTPPAPTSVYGATKLAQEHILASWVGSRGVALTILRLQNVYGPGQSLSNPYTGIVSLFSQLAREGREIPLYEDGEITRDFVFIDDVVGAIGAALASPPQSDTPRYGDVGTGVRTTIRQLAQAIADFYGAPRPVVTGQFRDGDVRHAACSVEATGASLGWSPQWTLERGVKALQGWIAEQQQR